jgi:exonuclease VII small subunit
MANKITSTAPSTLNYEEIKLRLNEILHAIENPEVKIDLLIPLLKEADALAKQAEMMLRDHELSLGSIRPKAE